MILKVSTILHSKKVRHNRFPYTSEFKILFTLTCFTIRIIPLLIKFLTSKNVKRIFFCHPKRSIQCTKTLLCFVVPETLLNSCVRNYFFICARNFLHNGNWKMKLCEFHPYIKHDHHNKHLDHHPRYIPYHTSQHDPTISPLSSSKLEPIQINYRSRCETFPINKTLHTQHNTSPRFTTARKTARLKKFLLQKKLYLQKNLIITGHHNHCLVLFIIESILKFWFTAPAAVPRLCVRLCLRRSQFLRKTFPHAEQL